MGVQCVSLWLLPKYTNIITYKKPEPSPPRRLYCCFRVSCSVFTVASMQSLSGTQSSPLDKRVTFDYSQIRFKCNTIDKDVKNTP